MSTYKIGKLVNQKKFAKNKIVTKPDKITRYYCQEILRNPSPPKLWQIAYAKFLNSRHLYNGEFVEEAIEYLLDRFPHIVKLEFKCEHRHPNNAIDIRFMYTFNNLTEVLKYEARFNRYLEEYYGRQLEHPFTVYVRLREEEINTWYSKNKATKQGEVKYRNSQCVVTTSSSGVPTYCYNHDSVI